MRRKTRVTITDTTLRDGHQSLWATRMKLSEMLPIAEKLDQVGYASLEVWGGATFDVALRFLNEDPWERLSELRRRIKRTRLQMLLRGQNVVGYRNYPDDVLAAFVEHAAERGIDVFRVFDALNDARNLEQAIRCVRKQGKHAQGTLCYAISPIHTVPYYLERAREQKALGIDSICIKDMAGILAPQTAFDLVSALVEEIKLPVQLHCHAASGMAVATYLRAIDAGVTTIDTAHAPLAFATSQPAVESIVAMLRDTPADPGLDLGVIEEISGHFDKVKAERGITCDRIVDEMVITHQIPGGMYSNLVSQLKEQKAVHRLKDVLEEVPRVREDMGFPPLVTPTSQMVGVQAVLNVLRGRYKQIPNEIRDYVRGLYGRSPAPIRDEVRATVLGNDAVITVRPADLLEPAMERVKAELPAEYVTKEEDYLSYALFPEVALRYFRWRKEPGKYPAAGSAAAAKKEESSMKAKDESPQASPPMIKELIELARAHDLTELEWEQNGTRVKVKRGALTAPSAAPTMVAVPAAVAAPTATVASPVPTAAPAAVSRPEAGPAVQLEEIKSPMVGTYYSRSRPDSPAFAEKGAIVEPGQTLCIIEAMKLMNEIEAEKKCRVHETLVSDGEAVEYGQVLFRVEPL
jgi:oxaloacetate decarboxylase alpha subunit